MKKKTLITAILTMALCMSLAIGSTFALFTSESKVNIAVTSGTVKVVASATQIEKGSDLASENVNFLVQEDGEGGFALSGMVIGDYATFEIKVNNKSDVDIKYQIVTSVTGELSPALSVCITDENGLVIANDSVSAWIYREVSEGEDIGTYTVKLSLPTSGDNATDSKYMGKTANVNFSVTAIQGNATVFDTWNGEIDTSWYDPAETSYTLKSAEALAGFAQLIDQGELSTYTVDGEDQLPGTIKRKTFTLDCSVDFEGQTWNPIGDNRTDYAFEGVFDGNGNTIKNIGIAKDSNFSGAVYGSKEGWGLFSLTDGATIKNLTVEGANFNSYTVITGAVVGYAYDTNFENVTVADAQISTYNWYSGGVAGWVGGKSTFTNVTVDADSSVGTLWGSYDTPCGGLIGGVSSSAEILIKDCNIACVVDAVNDVCSNYQWGAYRHAGMIIGVVSKTQNIDGTDYPDPSGIVTCENVTVTYGTWANYHYCEYEEFGKPSYAQEGQWKFGRVEASDYATDGIDHTACQHDTDETHYELIVFDQLFGGGDKGVYGLSAYDGVTVIYNNK